MAWDTLLFRLFVSHQSAIKDQAHDLKRWFEDGYGIDAFVAHDDIKPTLEWQDVIEDRLAEMDGLLSMLTPGFHESDWTDQEVGFGLGRGVLVLGLRLGQNPYGFLARTQGLQGAGLNGRELADAIFEVLATNPKTSARLTRALAEELFNSGSFDRSEGVVARLEKCVSCEQDAIDRMLQAAEENGQVSGATRARLGERVRAVATRLQAALTPPKA